MTLEEERDLAQQIEAGREAGAELEAKRMRGKRRSELQAIVADGQKARARLITVNLPLVGTLAMLYSHTGVELADLVGDGRIGLIIAVDTFDWRFNVPFSAWARKPIIQAIERNSMTTASALRLPVDALYDRRRIEAAREKLALANGREPTMAELAKATRLRERRVTEILMAPRTMVVVGPGEDEVLDDPGLAGDDDPAAAAVDADLLRRRSEAFDLWTAAEEQVVLARAGVTTGDPLSAQEVAVGLGIPLRTVKALERSAVMKTRHPRWKRTPATP